MKEEIYEMHFVEDSGFLDIIPQHKASDTSLQNYIVLSESCTMTEFLFFEAFAKRKDVKLTNEYMLNCIKEVKKMMENLLEFNLIIKHEI